MFIGIRNSGYWQMARYANSSVGEDFNSTGFKEGLYDKLADNQARHFIGGLITGFRLGFGLGHAVFGRNETSKPDLAMNEISIPLGAELTSPQPATTEVSRTWVRGVGWKTKKIWSKPIPANPGFRTLADEIRKQVCKKEE